MQPIMYRTRKTPMLIKIAAGFFVGMLFGFIAAPMQLYYPFMNDHVMPFLEFAGILFLRLLTIIILPLVFSSLVTGIASIGDTKKLGRITLKTVVLFLLTTIIAAVIGMLCAEIFKTGTSINIPADIQDKSIAAKPIRDMLLNILLPRNSEPSILHANVLHIILIAVLTGIACIFMGDTAKKITYFFGKMAEVMNKITYFVMNFAPYGVFALSATAAADFGLTLIVPFARIIGAVYSGCIAQALIVYSLMIMILCRRSPAWFFRGIREAAATAFITRSSSITLPLTLENVRKNLGVSEEISSFVIPLGATLNMNGTAIYQTVCAMFVARAFGVPITSVLQVKIFTASVIASIGTVGVPSAGMIMLTMVLAGAGLPVEGVGLLAGIDVVLGAARTCLNVAGDAAVCAVIAASEGEHLTEKS